MWSSIGDFREELERSPRPTLPLIFSAGTLLQIDKVRTYKVKLTFCAVTIKLKKLNLFQSDKEFESEPFSEKDERIWKKIKKIVLNDFSVETDDELDEADTVFFLPRRREEDCQLKVDFHRSYCYFLVILIIGCKINIFSNRKNSDQEGQSDLLFFKENYLQCSLFEILFR